MSNAAAAATATTETQQAEPVAQPFKYACPQMPEGAHAGKSIVRLARTDRMLANVQVLKNGGETNLHTHHHLDGFWMVLKGHARFYGESNEVVADLEAMDGVLIPRHFKYWFESVGDEVLEILQVECADFAMPIGKPIERENFTPLTNATRNITIIEGRVNQPEYGKSHKLQMTD